MPNDAATPEPDVGLIVLRTGKDLLDDLWTLYRGELQRMPSRWTDLTEDEREEIEVRAFATFENVVNAMAYRAATAAIAKGRPSVKGELVSVTVKDKARAVVEFGVGQPGLHDLIGETGSAVIIVLAGEVETVRADPKADEPKVDDKTPDMFDGPGGDDSPDCDCGAIHGQEELDANYCSACGKPISIPDGGVKVGDAPAPQPEPRP